MKQPISFFQSSGLVEPALRFYLFAAGIPVVDGFRHRLYSYVIGRRAARGLLGVKTIYVEGYNVCNLKCIMCPYPDMKREKVLMEMGLFQKIIDDACEHHVGQLSLNFYNEPLIDPLLFDRIAYAKGKGLRVRFDCNGTLLTEDRIARILGSGLDEISLSFDAATRETYEKIRRGASFEKIKGNIIKLIEEREKTGQEKPQICISLAAQKDNYSEIGEFERFWKKHVDYAYIRLVDERKSAELKAGRLDKYRAKHVYPCRNIFCNLHVMSNGQVALCCLDYDGSVILGDLNKQSLSEVWDSKKFQAIRQLHCHGEGDKVGLCGSLNCSYLSTKGIYQWWL